MRSQRGRAGGRARIYPLRVSKALAICLSLALLVLPFVSGIRQALAFVTTTIAIDGDISDWAGVRADPTNSIGDTVIPSDPDYPGQPDRDAYLASATYDSEYLYLSWRRTAGGVKAITFGAYIDADGDGRLEDGDRVVSWTVSTGAPYASAHSPSPSAWILLYNQARTKTGNDVTVVDPAGDGMGADGETPDGWADIQSGRILPVKPMDAQLDPAGIACEAKVAWSDLGIAPGSPINLHYSTGNGNAWGVKYAPSSTHKWTGSPSQWLEENRGQVEDNLGGMLGLMSRRLVLTPDNTGAGMAGSWSSYTHTVTNDSNVSQTIGLSAASSNGWTTSMTRSDGGPEVSSVTLGALESTSVVVNVWVPPGTPDGVRDTTVVRASLASDVSVFDEANDVTSVGRLALFPDSSGSMAPGQTITYPVTLTNNTPDIGTFDVRLTTTLGFPAVVRDSSGTVVSQVTLAAAASEQLYASVTVPATATVGQQDVTLVTAESTTDPAISATARLTTNVRDGLAITPDRASDGGAGTEISYSHTIINSWPTTRTISLSAVSSKGWPVAFYDADGVTSITEITIGPNGASRDIVVRVRIPSSAVSSDVDTTTVTATPSGGGASDSVVDVTQVRYLMTYANAAYGTEKTRYSLGETAYARATGLGSHSQVYFVWRDPNGTIVRTSPDRDVDSADMAYDDYPVPADAPTGGYTVELRDARTDDLIATTPLTVGFDAAISALGATDASTVGTTVTVSASLTNRSSVDVSGSNVRYVLWWDDDGDGIFDAGDTWIDESGAPQTWDGVSEVASHVTSGVNVASGSDWTEPGWSVSNKDFPNQGTYRITATWTSSTGQPIDTKTSEFYSVPTLGEFVRMLPSPALPAIAIGGALWAFTLVRLYTSRKWLRLYALGSLGTVLLVLFIAQALGLDTVLESIQAGHVAWLASVLHIKVASLPPSGLAIRNHVGWGVFDIGIECSALLEMGALAGLIGFYPAFSRGHKLRAIALGLGATYVANVLRILLIIGLIAMLGTEYVFMAHAVFGRVFFFTAVVVIYWVLVTLPTVRFVLTRLTPALSEKDAGAGPGDDEPVEPVDGGARVA